MSTIPLHPDRGLDPHLLICPVCKKETGLTVGDMRKAELPDGRTIYALRSKTKNYGSDIHWVQVPEHEKIPDSEPCPECKEKEKEQFNEEIKLGGIYFRCTECRQTGVIKYSDSTKALCEEVRAGNGVSFGEPCGIEFSKCKEHGS